VWLQSSSRTGESHERTRSIPCAAVCEGGAHAANDTSPRSDKDAAARCRSTQRARAHSDAKARGPLSLWTEAWPTQPNTVPEGKSVCRQKGDILPLRQVNANKSPQTLKRPTLRPQLPERRLTHHGACARCCRAAWRRQSRSGRPVRALRRRPWSMPTTARANREAGDAEARVRPVRSRFGRISVLGHAE